MSDFIPYLIVLAKCVFAVAFVMQIVPLLIWAERKGAAYIQDRPGPNRASVGGIRAGGLVHVINDVIKLIVKEDVVPSHVEKGLWTIAPMVSMTVALVTFIVVPFGDYIAVPDFGRISMQVSSIDGGLLFVLAMTSLGVYGIMLAGWASNNKFSLLGGLRASAQMISYELAMGMSAAVVFMMAGSVSLAVIAEDQSGPLWNWYVFSLPGLIAFVLFWVSAFAETNRTPFDLPEGDAELVGGFHTEYSALRFALFFMAEYANMVVASAVTATLFFGGYNIPFLNGETIRGNADVLVLALGGGGAVAFVAFAVWAWSRRNRPFYQALPKDDVRHREPKFFVGVWLVLAVASLGLAGLGAAGLVGAHWAGPELLAFALQVGSLVVKVLIGCWIMIWVRWTLPRFRYDQLMNLGWKYMLPLAIANVFVAAVWVIARETLFA